MFILLFALFWGFCPLFAEEIPVSRSSEFIKINSQVQLGIERSFKEGKYTNALGFYDPRIGAIVVVKYDGYSIDKNELNSDTPNPQQEERYKDVLYGKIQKTKFILSIRKFLQPNDRLILGTYSKDGYILEIWKKKMLDDLDDREKGKDVHELYKSGNYISFENGKNPVLGEYPNWDLQFKAQLHMEKKLKRMGFLDVQGMFVPVYGHIFLIETKTIPVKKMMNFDTKYSKLLREVQNSGEFLVEYFYGGERGDLSRFVKILDGKLQHLSYTRPESY